MFKGSERAARVNGAVDQPRPPGTALVVRLSRRIIHVSVVGTLHICPQSVVRDGAYLFVSVCR
jgi:hypothetical protein